jgi:hypothetical protein
MSPLSASAPEAVDSCTEAVAGPVCQPGWGGVFTVIPSLWSWPSQVTGLKELVPVAVPAVVVWLACAMTTPFPEHRKVNSTMIWSETKRSPTSVAYRSSRISV